MMNKHVGEAVSDSLNEWLYSKLTSILNFPVPQDLTQYILSIENARDLEDYLKTLLDFNNPQHLQFFKDLLLKRQTVISGGTSDYQVYKKSETDQVYISSTQTEKKKKMKNIPVVSSQMSNKGMPIKEFEVKKKSKFVNLYSSDGQAKDIILLKGRHHCDCQASKHSLINNCLSCGRIVCEQEGSGPCLFCGNLVCSREEQQFINSGTSEANQLYQKLIDQEKPEGWELAVQQRNRLLEYDRTSEKRTKVIDDESDYFNVSSVWLSPAEREKLKKQEEKMMEKRHASRLDRKITFDFAGRQVLEDDDYLKEEDIYLEENHNNFQDDGEGIGNVNSGLYDANSLVFQDSVGFGTSTQKYVSTENERNNLHKRVQDREMLEMTDDGHCLSMHQPWASLLVAGIKIHEGRTWYTSHRGILWIAAASKTPTQEEIKEIEHVYEVLNGHPLKFPSLYPTSCLLGCVNVVDCLPQEEYRAKFPEGESDSPFVFICEDPKELPIRFPIQGKHKIYKLDPNIHKAAQKTLQKISKIQAERIL